jgi:hypothetical protein
MVDQKVDDPGQGGSNLFVASSDHGQSVVDDLFRRQQVSPHAVDHVFVVHVLFLLSIILGRHVFDCLILDSLPDLVRLVAGILHCLDGEKFEQPERKEVHDDLKQVGIGAGVEELQVAQHLVVSRRLERIEICTDAIFPDRVETQLAEHAAEIDRRFVCVRVRGHRVVLAVDGLYQIEGGRGEELVPMRLAGGTEGGLQSFADSLEGSVQEGGRGRDCCD